MRALCREWCGYGPLGLLIALGLVLAAVGLTLDALRWAASGQAWTLPLAVLEIAVAGAGLYSTRLLQDAVERENYR